MTKLRRSLLLFGSVGVAAIACGGRTGDLLPTEDFRLPDGGLSDGGTGGVSSVGGGVNRAGAGGRGSGGVTPGGGRSGSAGVAGRGGVGPIGGAAGYAAYPSGGYAGFGAYPSGGYAGYPSGGYAGFGAYPSGGFAGFGGFGAVAGALNCSQPFCSCGDCLSACVCRGYDKSYCATECFGTGGSPADAGTTLICPNEVCPETGLTECCTFAGRCGVDFSSFGSILGIAPVCQQFNQPGTIDYSCPSTGTLVGAGAPDFPGCCRPDGTCGVALNNSLVSLGCVLEQYGGIVRSCGGVDSGTIASGGSVSTGGSVGAGGAGADACLSQARSACEKCACGSCYDSLIPCFKDAACPQILACANRTGCTGIDCYQQSTCQTVIDQSGGISSNSLALAIPLFACVSNSGCPCGFAK
jgi:hypothetical protein